ncbi:MAG: PTS sugar transporter subunit IIA [Spirochaetes bacterium]|nr:PTS sugar transporter subunit IIA [Spirochaetota bacterium]
MDLKIKDLVELFKLSEKTIYRWIKEKKIPAYRINHQFRFSKSEINEWILKNKIKVSDKFLELQTSIQPVNLIDLLNKGGFFYKIEGKSVNDVINNAINIIPLPDNINKNDLESLLLERERMMSTSIGHGIAVPHPRNPIITEIENARISVCFLKNSIDFKSMDNELVHTLFIILTANPKRHLEVLAKISFLCRQDDFRELLKKHAPKKRIISYIEEKQKEWKKRKVANE